MKTSHVLILTATAVIVAASVPATGRQDNAPPATEAAPLPSGGMLRTMPLGDYQCALPGDAGAGAYVEVEAENFRISTASRYFSMDGDGTYIMRGDELTFTRGPKKGERFLRVGDNQLRKLDNEGKRSTLLCTRTQDRR
ncbi:elongation factor P [Erythrobacter sp. KY5]|uniref:elongation factor P n=1 Tax=Erythrobacter sp. KY5 TaxID=2011159 RepID=UPI000DBF008F|nr:elongation factor P [Erythrobacter sp. KY5]AWW74593.1 elongation factor P [Erythrobacter sp. KY5]